MHYNHNAIIKPPRQALAAGGYGLFFGDDDDRTRR
jgi:hypothetical protein